MLFVNFAKWHRSAELKILKWTKRLKCISFDCRLDLTSIPHNPPPYNDNSPTATASAPSSPLHSGERRGDGGGSKHRLNNNSQQGPSNTPRGGKIFTFNYKYCLLLPQL